MCFEIDAGMLGRGVADGGSERRNLLTIAHTNTKVNKGQEIFGSAGEMVVENWERSEGSGRGRA